MNTISEVHTASSKVLLVKVIGRLKNKAAGLHCRRSEFWHTRITDKLIRTPTALALNNFVFKFRICKILKTIDGLYLCYNFFFS
jgi:hypothetical protein